MKVTTAKSAGFCTGVKRAVNMALDISRSGDGPFYTYGPLVHNDQAVQMLRSRGIRDVEDLEGLPPGTVIIRAHGIRPDEQAEIEARGFQVADATCPHIVASRKLILKHLAKGYEIILVGDHGHPEMLGLLGYAQGRGRVVSSLEEARSVTGVLSACVIAQTTFNADSYARIAQELRSRIPTCEVFNTVCLATKTRQDEVQALAREVEAMVIVGGIRSANTKRLFEIAEASKPAFCVETAAQLDLSKLARYETVGVTAGASTPNWAIREVVEALRSIGKPPRKRTRSVLLWHLIIDTQLFLGIGAAFLTLACCTLQGLPFRPRFAVASFLYVLGVHLLNRLSGATEDEFDEPLRSRFFDRHRGPLTGLAWLASGAALVASLSLGILPFLIVLFCTLGGVLYRFPFLPASGGRRLRPSDLPGSKDFALSTAWAAVTTLVPSLSEPIHLQVSTCVAGFFAFSLMFIRSTLFDVKDIQGDKIVGTEMIPVLLGKARTKGMLAAIGLVQIAILILFSRSGDIRSSSLWLVLPVMYAGGYLWLYHQRRLSPRLLCGLVADGNFIFAGLLALL